MAIGRSDRKRQTMAWGSSVTFHSMNSGEDEPAERSILRTRRRSRSGWRLKATATEREEPKIVISTLSVAWRSVSRSNSMPNCWKAGASSILSCGDFMATKGIVPQGILRPKIEFNCSTGMKPGSRGPPSRWNDFSVASESPPSDRPRGVRRRRSNRSCRPRPGAGGTGPWCRSARLSARKESRARKVAFQGTTAEEGQPGACRRQVDEKIAALGFLGTIVHGMSAPIFFVHGILACRWRGYKCRATTLPMRMNGAWQSELFLNLAMWVGGYGCIILLQSFDTARAGLFRLRPRQPPKTS